MFRNAWRRRLFDCCCIEVVKGTNTNIRSPIATLNTSREFAAVRSGYEVFTARAPVISIPEQHYAPACHPRPSPARAHKLPHVLLLVHTFDNRCGAESTGCERMLLTWLGLTDASVRRRREQNASNSPHVSSQPRPSMLQASRIYMCVH